MSDDARSDYGGFITCMIEDYRCRRVCEVGGGANPLLSIKFTANQGLDYFILDISQEELDKAPNEYQKICFDIAAQDFNADGNFDLVFSSDCDLLHDAVPVFFTVGQCQQDVKDGRCQWNQLVRVSGSH